MITLANMLAQSRVAEKLQKIRGGFNDRPTNPADLTGVFLTILIPISFVLLILLVRNLIARYKKGHGSPAHPMRLFDTVLKKMGMKFSDRFLLRALARSSHLNHPTVVFFSRETFKRHATAWIEKLSIKPIQHHAKARMSVISELAFGPEPEPIVESGVVAAVETVNEAVETDVTSDSPSSDAIGDEVGLESADTEPAEVK